MPKNSDIVRLGTILIFGIGHTFGIMLNLKGFFDSRWLLRILEGLIEFPKYFMLRLNLLSAHCNPSLRDRFIDSNGSVLCPIVSFTISNSLPSTVLSPKFWTYSRNQIKSGSSFQNPIMKIFQLCGDDEGRRASKKKIFLSTRDTTTRNARETFLEDKVVSYTSKSYSGLTHTWT